MTVPSRSGIASFFTSAIWKRSIGTCCGLRPHAQPFDAGLDKLFAFGIDPVDGGLPSDQPSDWPVLEDVRRYGARIRKELDAALDRVPENLLNTAIEHRLMHAETLAYMLHQLPLEKKIRQRQTDVPERGQPRPESIEIPEGSITLGALSRCRGLRLGQRIRCSHGEPFLRSRSIGTKLRTASSSISCEQVGIETGVCGPPGIGNGRHRTTCPIPLFGNAQATIGIYEPCLKRSRCRFPGRFT